MKSLCIGFMMGLLFLGCTATRTSDAGAFERDHTVTALSEKESVPEFTLENYLMRMPGVVVIGSGSNATVSVRGVNTATPNTGPLFIVNGADVGNNYYRASELLRGVKIKAARVLKDADATIYGMRGGNGVIIIVTE